jgi:endopeptidase La
MFKAASKSTSLSTMLLFNGNARRVAPSLLKVRLVTQAHLPQGIFSYPSFHFSSTPGDGPVTPKKKSAKKVAATEEEGAATEVPKKRTRASKKQSPVTVETPKEPEVPLPPVVHRLYTLKFNSPILPFAKFPLTQNKYI